jgi:hypothetical protein
MTTDEVINLAGGDAMTLPAEVLEELSKMPGEKEDLEARSVFRTDSHNPTKQFERLSYIDDRVKFLRAFTANGKGKSKTEDVSRKLCYILRLFFSHILLGNCNLLRIPNPS